MLNWIHQSTSIKYAHFPSSELQSLRTADRVRVSDNCLKNRVLSETLCTFL